MVLVAELAADLGGVVELYPVRLEDDPRGRGYARVPVRGEPVPGAVEYLGGRELHALGMELGVDGVRLYVDLVDGQSPLDRDELVELGAGGPRYNVTSVQLLPMPDANGAILLAERETAADG